MISEYRHTETSPYHISAGGVPYFIDQDGSVKVVIVGESSKGFMRYSLPKGTLHHYETLEDCAKREVLEESGCETKVTGLLGGSTRDYTDGFDGLHTNKTIIYFALEIISRTSEHDNEYEVVELLDIDEAILKLIDTRPEKEEYQIIARLKAFLQSNTDRTS